MRGRILCRAALSAVLFWLAVAPSSALGSHATGPGLPVPTGYSPGAGAPRFISEVDTGDTGLYASPSYDPSRDAIYGSYHDSTIHALRLARSLGLEPEVCGPNGEWSCFKVDSGPAVGKYGSIAVNPKTDGRGSHVLTHVKDGRGTSEMTKPTF